MINVKDQVYDAIKGISENVSDGYPKDWGILPAIQYTEEDNSVTEWVDGKARPICSIKWIFGTMEALQKPR